ncbi:MAG TPA: DUF1080 domain-containing protein [Solirubrobacter sp.]|nr:DUF1080 domain-containing protein [Solirubrobacter sp.]
MSIRLACRALAAAIAAMAVAAAPAAADGKGKGKGYKWLFDGSKKSFERWTQAPNGSFELRKDKTIVSVGGLGMLWYPAKQYGDFSLKLQFRDERTDDGYSNSGVFVRFPDLRDVPSDERPECGKLDAALTSQAWVAIYCGQEIQIYDGPEGEPQKTGSIYNFDPLDLTQAMPTPKGKWNDYEIRVVGQHYTIIRNGVVINEFDNTPGKQSSRAGDPPTDQRQFEAGYIGLQNHSTNDRIAFRKVRIKKL